MERATFRVDALCDLHGCGATRDDKNALFTVHAKEYYRKSTRKNPRKRTKSQHKLTRARAAKLQAKHYLNKKFGKFAGARRNPSGVRIVYNKLLGGWYVVRGPHQTPLNGRFNSKAEAQAYLRGDYRRNPRRKVRRNSIQKKPVHRKSIVLSVKAGNHWVPLKIRHTSKEKAVAEARRLSKYWRAPIKISTER